MVQTNTDPANFSFSTCPKRYRHIELSVKGDEATITLNVNPDHGLLKDTQLKLNSYDLSVDIELADALNRLRFSYPQVNVVVITSGHPQIFSSGANIYMLKKSSHAFKVNFCKYTNETRLYLEEASSFSNKKFLCALNGTAAGGGYELALACDRIVLMDDKFANVSLPEVPLLGVLPGTGGLTRLTDKRKIRRDVADVFCTVAEGIKGKKAKDWRLVDEIYQKSQWTQSIKNEVEQLKKTAVSSKALKGIDLPDIAPIINNAGFHYEYVEVLLADDRSVKIVVKGPREPQPTNAEAMLEKGSELWLLRAFRELDDAILRLRFFFRDHGLWEFHTQGDVNLILAAEQPLYEAMQSSAHWFLRELLLHIRRVYRRLDVSARSMVSVITPSSAYVGVLAELLFACDRSYGLVQGPTEANIALSPFNSGLLPTWNEQSRLALRFIGQAKDLELVYKKCHGGLFSLTAAYEAGLITFVLDEIDFADELRLFKEERTSLSPDALTAMEASLRFAGPETLATKIFGRLSAWQNWVFIRDNATGERGALMSYGEDLRPSFVWERC